MASPLNRGQLAEDPVEQFAIWFDQAKQAAVHYPHAMGLSTVSTSMELSSRIVLLRYFDRQGFVFFSGYETEKAAHIAQNPSVALLFSWLELERQLRIRGTAKKISARESLKFFISRSREGQLGAWLSQSEGDIGSRDLLKKTYAKAKQRFQDGKIPLPEKWGGYLVEPDRFEFWQGRKDGLHDRFRYTKIDEQGWEIRRLLP